MHIEFSVIIVSKFLLYNAKIFYYSFILLGLSSINFGFLDFLKP